MGKVKDMHILDTFQLAPPDGDCPVAPAVDQFVQLAKDLAKGFFFWPVAKRANRWKLGGPLSKRFSIFRS
jgi:hypothetical protein